MNTKQEAGAATPGVWSRLGRMRRRFGARNMMVALANRVLARDGGKRLPGHGRMVGLRVTGLEKPVYVRLGTSDLWVFEEIFLDAEYGAVQRLHLGDVRVIVDLGSNIGLSIRYWRMLYPEARIVAVEPDGANMAVCAKNAGAAGGPETVLVQGCVAGTSRTVRLNRSAPAWAFRIEGADTGSAGRSIEGAGGGQDAGDQIDALTLPEVLEKAGVSGEIDLLKCDIEGSEAEVFAHCGAWIGRVRTMVIELHGAYTREKFERDLEAAGYRSRITSLKHIDDVHVLMVEREGAAG